MADVNTAAAAVSAAAAMETVVDPVMDATQQVPDRTAATTEQTDPAARAATGTSARAAAPAAGAPSPTSRAAKTPAARAAAPTAEGLSRANRCVTSHCQAHQNQSGKSEQSHLNQSPKVEKANAARDRCRIYPKPRFWQIAQNGLTFQSSLIRTSIKPICSEPGNRAPRKIRWNAVVCDDFAVQTGWRFAELAAGSPRRDLEIQEKAGFRWFLRLGALFRSSREVPGPAQTPNLFSQNGTADRGDEEPSSWHCSRRFGRRTRGPDFPFASCSN